MPRLGPVVTAVTFVALVSFAATVAPPARAASSDNVICQQTCQDDSVQTAIAALEDLRQAFTDAAPDGGLLNALKKKIDGIESSVVRIDVNSALNQFDALENSIDAGTTQARESRGYTAISNIMKTKHDTVKNSISNVR